MKLTVVRRTSLGFALLLILMSIIAAAALQTQRSTQSSVTQLADDVLPRLQSSSALLVSAQNINKAITQHANEREPSVMEEYEAEFAREVAAYNASYAELRAQLGEDSGLGAALADANEPVSTMIEQGQAHMPLHRAILDARAVYQEEAQAGASSWLRYPNEMQIVDRVVEVTAQNQDSQASLIGSDTSYVRDKIDLVRGDLGRVATATSVEEVRQVQEQLQFEVSNTLTRIDRLADNNEIIHQRLSPFVANIDRSVNNPEGVLTLQLNLLEQETESRRLLNQIASDINAGVLTMQALSADIASEARAVQREMGARNDSAQTTIVATYIISLVLALVIVIGLIRSIRQPLNQIVDALEDISSGNLTRAIRLKGQDEFSLIADGINQLSNRLREILQSIAETSGKVTSVTDQVSATTEGNRKKLKAQKEQTDSVATAVTEMEAAASEVSNSADGTLKEVEHVHSEALDGQRNMTASVTAIRTLEKDLEQAGAVIDELNVESDNIGNILNVIKGIAEQTNLLALNAAIEAARAGEQGRGFAVVADEVRDLASKTQASTEEIYRMIEALQSRSKSAVQLMQSNRKQSQDVVRKTEDTSRSIDHILVALENINNMTQHIATAASEQRKVAADVSANTVLIADMADDVVSNAARNSEAFTVLAELTHEQETLIGRFRYK